MADLKSLLGENYKEGMTSDEIVKAISTNDKLVNLSSGEYVAKGKFDDLSSKYSKTMEETKDYETFKQKAAEYESYKKDISRKEIFRKSGIKDEFLDYASYQVEKGLIPEDDKFADNVNEWVKKNPTYAVVKSDDAGKDKNPDSNKKDEPKPAVDKAKAKVIIKDIDKGENALPTKSWNKKKRLL